MISKTTCAMLAAVMCAAATPAGAACQRLAFLVNDYGKDGPTNALIVVGSPHDLAVVEAIVTQLEKLPKKGPSEEQAEK